MSIMIAGIGPTEGQFVDFKTLSGLRESMAFGWNATFSSIFVDHDEVHEFFGM